MLVKRGDIFFAALNPVQGSEQGGTRPVIVVQNDVGNQYSPTTIVLAITSQINKAKLPTHVEIPCVESGLNKDSVVLAEQLRTIDKSRLIQKIATVEHHTMEKIDKAMAISIGLGFARERVMVQQPAYYQENTIAMSQNSSALSS